MTESGGERARGRIVPKRGQGLEKDAGKNGRNGRRRRKSAGKNRRRQTGKKAMPPSSHSGLGIEYHVTAVR
jgi:hypothetical protein